MKDTDTDDPAMKQLAHSTRGAPTVLLTRASSLIKHLSMAYTSVALIMEGTSAPEFMFRALDSTTSLAASAARWGVQLWCFVSTGSSHTQSLLNTFLGKLMQIPESRERRFDCRMCPIPDEPHPAEAFLCAFAAVNPVSARRWFSGCVEGVRICTCMRVLLLSQCILIFLWIHPFT